MKATGTYPRHILRPIIAALFTVCGAHAAVAGSNNTMSIGIEGFYDRYREPAPDVTVQSGYGSLTGSFSHDWGNSWGSFFHAIDGRFSYGWDNYSSPSGSLSGNPQKEFELRLREGTTFNVTGGALCPYLGLGSRYFIDEGKGSITSLGDVGYDRRIFQLYVPIGLTYAHTSESGWTYSPNIEYDQLVYGNVNSRLQNDGYYNINNEQTSGSGWRGSFMIGEHTRSGYSWQVGPFVRYWDIPNSKITTTPDGAQWIEPKNDRMQLGLAARILW